MLSGLLHPTAGEVTVLGHVPSQREKALPAADHPGHGPAQPAGLGHPRGGFLRAQPRHLPHPRRRLPPHRCDELIELLELGPLLRKPVRNLSLGRADEVRDRRRAPAPAPGGLPGRADHRAGRDDAAAHPRASSRSTTGASAPRCCSPATTWPTWRRCAGGSSSSTTGSSSSTASSPRWCRGSPRTRPSWCASGTADADLSAYGEVVSCEDGRATLRVPKEETARVTGRLLADLPGDRPDGGGPAHRGSDRAGLRAGAHGTVSGPAPGLYAQQFKTSPRRAWCSTGPRW